MGGVGGRDGRAIRVGLERQRPGVSGHEPAILPGKLGEVLQGAEQTISDHEFRTTAPGVQSWHQMRDPLGLVGLAVEVGGHVENQPVAGSVGDEQFPAQKFARCTPGLDQSLGDLLETLAVEDENLEGIDGGGEAVGDDVGEQGGEAVGDVAEEGLAQTRGDAAELAVEGFVAGVVALPVAVEEGLPTGPVVFDEGIEDPGDELREGHDVFIAATTMSVEQVGEDGVGNAVGEECEGGVGQRKAIKDLACEVGGRWRG